MSNASRENIAQIGSLQVYKFLGEGSLKAAVYDPREMGMSLNIAADSKQPDGSYYILRWNTAHDKSQAARELSKLALPEPSQCYVIRDEFGACDQVATPDLQQNVEQTDCVGLRVDQVDQAFLWQKPLHGESTSRYVAFLTAESDIASVNVLAVQTISPRLLNFAREHLPLFHQAYEYFAPQLIDKPSS
jgi:hypothetical protein